MGRVFEFAPEWCLLGVVAIFDGLWATEIGFHLIVTWSAAAVCLAGPGAALLFRRLFKSRIGAQIALIAEYFCLTIAATFVFDVFSYLAFASSGPLIDDTLLAADRALGFDWLAGFHFLQTHALLAKSLLIAYDSLFYQGIYFCLLMGLLLRRQAMREVFWLGFVAALLTSLGALFLPAMGPYLSLGADPHHYFLGDMIHLKSGKNLTFALAQMTGVVSFPSLHTTMALIYVYAFRRAGVIAYFALGLNALMLCSVPYFGGHYLVDMFAGAGVFILSLAAVLLVRNWQTGAADLVTEKAADALA